MYEEIGKRMLEKEPAKGKAKSAKQEMPDFARAMKLLREDADLSLEKLSKLTGINKQTLHSIENYSIKNPSFANLEKIATAFELSMNDLLLRARGEFRGNLYKTTAADRWSVSYETSKGFSIHAYSPPSATERDFFIGVLSIQGGKKLRHWKFKTQSKACIQPWDGHVLFTYHGMNWRREERVLTSETLYYDASIPHSFENLSDRPNRVLLITYPSIF